MTMNATMVTTKIQESRAKKTQPIPASLDGTHMIVPRGIGTYPSFPEWKFLTDMSVTTRTTKKRVKSHKGHSANYTSRTPAPPAGKADNGAQRDYNIPITFQIGNSPQL